ncbi:MAG: hypothetical protein GWP91_03790 [Rhodobacterales bacterium]|nr:hypothetical protein [Rhodobacterales bacterium]
MRYTLPVMLLALAAGCKSPDDTSTTTTTDPEAPRADAPYYAADHIVEVDIQMSTVDFELLRLQTRDILDVLGGDCLAHPAPSPYTYLEASVTIDGQTVDNVGVRKKGFIGSLSYDKPGLKIKFDEYIDDGNLSGMTRFTLNNNVQDPAIIRQCLGYQVFRDAGIPSPRCNFAHVTVNGEDLGIYSHIEAVKRDFLRQHYSSDDGHLYEGTLSDFRTEWLGTLDAKTDSTDVTKAPLLPLVAALEFEDDALLAALEPILDIDDFLTFYATEVLVGHWDGYAGNTNNFFAYVDPSDGKVRMMPWGIDGIMGEVNPFGEGPTSVVAQSLLAQRIYNHPNMTEAYVERLHQLLDTAWDEDQLLAEVDRMSALVKPYALEPDYAGEAQEGLRIFIRDRRDAIVDATASGPEVWAYGPRPSPCLVLQGPLSMTFDTTWETLEVPDPFGEGSCSVDLTWEGIPFPTMMGGAIAGTIGPGQGVVAALVLDEATLWQPIAVFSTDDMAPNTVIPLDLFSETLGVLNWMDLTTMIEPVSVGYLLEGQLTFDQAEDTPGAQISGHFEANTWAF